MNSKRVYILGAGSSIGHSLGRFPSITSFFSIARELGIDSEFDDVSKLGRELFGVDIFQHPINIEDFYTHLEIEIERNPDAELLKTRQQLLDLIKKTLFSLGNRLTNSNGEYNAFTDRKHPILQKDDTIITFNWDLLLDNLFEREKIIEKPYIPTDDPHYYNFIEFLSAYREMFRSDIIPPPHDDEYYLQRGYYLKMHGSIDWTYCNNQGCSNFQKVFPIKEPLKIYRCNECFEFLETMLIPPLLNKGYRHYPIIRKIWNLAALVISSATEIIIWGYSLPSTDFYSKWLIRQANKDSLKKIILVNPDVTKNDFINRFKVLFENIQPTLTWEYYESFNIFVQNNQIISPDK
jgi:hypothetical protein